MVAGEHEAGVALRALRDEPAPPLATTLEQVMRLGRRRRRTQRLGVVAIVVAVVAAVGGGALALWTGGVDPELAGAELYTEYQWPEPLAGWSMVTAAGCGGQTGSSAADVTIMPRAVVEPVFVSTVAEVTGGPANLTVSLWDEQPRGYTEVEVPVDKAWGTVHLEATVAATGPPSAAADADIGVYGVCSMPLRKVLATGTVMQLYEPDARSPSAPVQHLRTYLPNGLLYVVSSAGWSRADDQGGVVRSGRGKLPLDSQQLADVADRIAALE